MGEVYRARDTKLGREVAIKVLPPEFASDPERLARFAREARVLATLNHPHIGAIYGFEETADSGRPAVRALVLELVEGETLQDRIARGSVPVDEALAYALQIAAALDAAHEKGIVHRDLKPANVKVTPEGVLKVLDFGLAKAALEEGVSPVLSDSPTITAAATREGTILGTAAYMSPEQARGRPVDKRTDIWAFGCVLHELITGRSPFLRESVTDTLSAIVTHEPDWSVLPDAVPPAVRDLLRRCLEKDVRRRLRDIGDASICLDAPAALQRSESVAAPRSAMRNLAWALGGAIVTAAVVVLWSLRSALAPVPAPTARAVQRLTDFVGMEESPVVSPDGKTVAFIVRTGGHSQIWLRLLAGGAPLQVTHDAADHEQPRWTPDSSSLVYFTPASTPGEQGTLWEVSALGGERRRLASAISGADISHDGRYLATLTLRGNQRELTTLTRDGAHTVRTQAVGLGDAGFNAGSVRWSPDDRWLSFQQEAVSLGFDGRIFIVPASGGEPVTAARGPFLSGFAWLPDSSGIVYSSPAGSTVLYPPSFNLRAVARDGTGDRQLTFGEVSYLEPDVTASSAVAATRTRIQSDIWRFPVDGSPAENTRGAVRVTRQTGLAQSPSVSPDGKELAYLSDSGGHGNIWVAKTDGSGARQITFERDPAVSIGVPTWSSLGPEIAFIVIREGTTGLWLVNSDGSGLREIVPSGHSACWSADDRWLYYSTVRTGAQCIEKVPVQGGAAVSVRCDNARSPAVARSGTALYYVSWLGIDHEIRRADPEGSSAAEGLGRVAGSRVPVAASMLLLTLSPDGAWLAMPLEDGATSNLWLQPTGGGAMKQVTDFGDRAVIIARHAAWSPDSRFLFAAVADVDADIVLWHGLLSVK
jgi:serine/threonine-protein kinase